MVDTGIDFRHEDFITNENGKPVSRLRYFWDTTATFEENGVGQPAELKYPNGAPIGVIYSQAELTSELRRPTGFIQQTDLDGHGTACAGIAAGNGRSSKGKYQGVAPKADLICIRIGRGPALPNSYLLNPICSWLDRVVAGQPLVITCSFAAQTGGHDGYRLSERQLDARLHPDRKGRLMCVAAGNEGEFKLHAQSTLERGATDLLEWKSERNGRISLFADLENANDLQLTFDTTKPIEISRYRNPLSDTTVHEFGFDASAKSLMRIKNLGSTTVQVDAFIAENHGGAEFLTRNIQNMQIGTPGCAANVLTIGSYDFNDAFDSNQGVVRLGGQGAIPYELELGNVSAYSSRGPLRKSMAQIKPDLVAPGQYFTAPAASGTKVKFLDSSGKYRLFNGTSAATPYTAGILALLLEKHPELDLTTVRQLLKAKGDGFVGDDGEIETGFGHLNLELVRHLMRSIRN